jgi:hypothetical protein
VVAASRVKTPYIEPGFSGRTPTHRHSIAVSETKLLKREVFTGLVEVKILVEEYGTLYNYERPYSP